MQVGYAGFMFDYVFFSFRIVLVFDNALNTNTVTLFIISMN